MLLILESFLSKYWQPGCIWVAGKNNVTVRNNEITNTAYVGIGVRGHMPHGGSFFQDQGIAGNDDFLN